MVFTESPSFTRECLAILSETQYFELQNQLIDFPETGDLIPGSKGLRRVRVASSGKGKRGGSRVIYYWYVEPKKI